MRTYDRTARAQCYPCGVILFDSEARSGPRPAGYTSQRKVALGPGDGCPVCGRPLVEPALGGELRIALPVIGGERDSEAIQVEATAFNMALGSAWHPAMPEVTE